MKNLNLIKKNFNIPNVLTLFRIALVPVIMSMVLKKNYLSGFIVFLLVAITDFLDGYFARKFNQITFLGAILDPIADKLLIVGLYLAFYLSGPERLMPGWFLVLIIAKEILLLLGAWVVCCLKKLTAVKPTLLAKVLMLVNSLFIAILFLHKITGLLNIEFIYNIYLCIAFLAILVSLQYFLIFIKVFKKL